MTSISWRTSPISSVKSTRIVEAEFSVIPDRMIALKPCFSARIVYVPTGRSGTVYVPASLLSVVEDAPVAGFVTMIFAPGTTAPALSRTVPLMVPRPDWASTGMHPSNKAPTTRKDK